MISKNYVLIGFMGCGKTTVGRLLAAETGFTFYDSDEEIVKSENMDINFIFDKFGEVYFRKLEKNTIAGLSNLTEAVIATGGGAVKDALNMEALARNGLIVYLKCSPEKLLRNTENDDSRPLLRRGERAGAIKDLLDKREPLYVAHCHRIIDVTEISAEEAVRQILTGR